MNIAEVKEQFPNLERKIRGKRLVYLDSAATTFKTRSVINALTDHYSQDVSNIHRGVHHLSEQGTIKYEETRLAAQSFIGASSSREIILTSGTTDSINLVARSYAGNFLQKGQAILLTTMEHHSNIVPWQMVAEEKGLKILECPVLPEGELDLESYEDLLKNHDVGLVSLVHISNTLGTINPAKKLAKLAHDHGAKFCLDAAQSISHMPLDVKDLDCDFLAFSGHKMFGPTGTGVLYGKESLLEVMPPVDGGGAMIDVVTMAKTSFASLPGKFEAGTPHIAGHIAFKHCFDFITKLGAENIFKYEHTLLEKASSALKEIDGLKIIGEAKKKASVISFSMDGAHPHDLGTLLDQQGIAIRTGHHCTWPLMEFYKVPATARASFSIYNDESDIDALVQGITKAKELL